METRVADIGDGIYQLTTYLPDIDFTVNQYLLTGDEPLLFHTGMRGLFPDVSAAVADRVPRPLAPGEKLDLGGQCVEWIDTPHVPHAWEAGVLFDHSTGTLLCGDLFSQSGSYEPVTFDDILGPAIEAEDAFASMSLHPATGSIIRSLSGLDVRALAPMHGPVFTGNCSDALQGLADDADRRVQMSGLFCSSPSSTRP